VIGGSVPGLGMSYDRKKQLLIIDHNLNKKQGGNLEQMDSDTGFAKDQKPAQEYYGLYDGKNVSSGVYDKRLSRKEDPGYRSLSQSMPYMHKHSPMKTEPADGQNLRPATPRNEFEYIRLKNGQWPGKLNIISNQIRY
jgi:hypothetical protein